MSLRRIGTIALFLVFLIPLVTSAHPGNTDSNGGHYCWTNCEKWDLEYGEYHYHNNPSGGAHYTDGYNRGYELAYSYTSVCEEEYKWWWEGPQEFGNGYEAGINDGHYDGLLVCFEDSYQIGYDNGFDDYMNGNNYSEVPDLKVDEPSYGKGYAEGFADAKKRKCSKKHDYGHISFFKNIIR